MAAHHLIDRSLWESSLGYFIDNGVSLCARDHLKAERTLINPWVLRECAGITNRILPEHFDPDCNYDHWGNTFLHTGVRYKGELFYEENVQKALKDGDVLSSFTSYVKYSRTYHFPWSPNLQNDDRMHTNIDFFEGKTVVGTIKEDGENTSMYPDYIHARSIDSKHHESRNWVKALHGSIKHDIPTGWRICGESMYAKHSIHYHHLPGTFFLVFSIWNESNICLSWDETKVWCDLLDLTPVPEFYRGLGPREGREGL